MLPVGFIIEGVLLIVVGLLLLTRTAPIRTWRRAGEARERGLTPIATERIQPAARPAGVVPPSRRWPERAQPPAESADPVLWSVAERPDITGFGSVARARRLIAGQPSVDVVSIRLRPLRPGRAGTPRVLVTRTTTTVAAPDAGLGLVDFLVTFETGRVLNRGAWERVTERWTVTDFGLFDTTASGVETAGALIHHLLIGTPVDAAARKLGLDAWASGYLAELSAALVVLPWDKRLRTTVTAVRIAGVALGLVSHHCVLAIACIKSLLRSALIDAVAATIEGGLGPPRPADRAVSAPTPAVPNARQHETDRGPEPRAEPNPVRRSPAGRPHPGRPPSTHPWVQPRTDNLRSERTAPPQPPGPRPAGPPPSGRSRPSRSGSATPRPGAAEPGARSGARGPNDGTRLGGELPGRQPRTPGQPAIAPPRTGRVDRGGPGAPSPGR